MIDRLDTLSWIFKGPARLRASKVVTVIYIHLNVQLDHRLGYHTTENHSDSVKALPLRGENELR